MVFECFDPEKIVIDMKICNFQGELTDISAKTIPLDILVCAPQKLFDFIMKILCIGSQCHNNGAILVSSSTNWGCA